MNGWTGAPFRPLERKWTGNGRTEERKNECPTLISMKTCFSYSFRWIFTVSSKKAKFYILPIFSKIDQILSETTWNNAFSGLLMIFPSFTKKSQKFIFSRFPAKWPSFVWINQSKCHQKSHFHPISGRTDHIFSIPAL